jgi:uncharacterized sulfatase
MKHPTILRPILAAVAAISGLALPARAADTPPNIVLIISDDQGWTDYGFMGHEVIRTPRIDRLAGESIVFRHGYVATALCRPALNCFATGLYAHQSRITGNDPGKTPENEAHAKRTGKTPKELLISNIDHTPTLPRLLAKKGYLSFQCGKWWEGSYQRGGFTHGMTRGYPKPGGRHGDDGLSIGRKGMKPLFDFMDIAVGEKKPFFVWYAPFLPHTPHNPPKRLLDKYTAEDRPLPIAKYYAMCEWFDETCGQLLDRLDEIGVADDTLVVYVTDNGWIQNPKGNGFAPRSKLSAYEGGVRTPIMFRWPGRMKSADRPELCGGIDLVPTILAAAGVEAPDNLPGLNLLPHLRGATPIDRDTLFGESFAHNIADVEKPEASLLRRWVIKGKHKLLLTYDGRHGGGYGSRNLPEDPGPELFDLEADPHEKNNLAADNPELVEKLGALIHDWYPLEQRKPNALPIK